MHPSDTTPAVRARRRTDAGARAATPERWTGLAGITPVLVTPFSADETIDRAAVRAEVAFVRDLGARAVTIGLASEVTRLTEAESLELVELVRDALDDSDQLVVSCTADSSLAAADLATRLAGAGADVLMVTPPRAPGAPTAAIVEFYTRLAEASGAAIIVQDAPQETGVPIDDDTLAGLAADLPAVAAVKLESPDALDRMARLAEPLAEHGVGILGGSGGAAYLTEFELGAIGTLPGPALVDVFIAIDRALRSGDTVAARELMQRFEPQIGVARIGMPAFIVAQKRILAARGLDFPAALRAPAALLDADATQAIDALCAALPAALPIRL